MYLSHVKMSNKIMALESEIMQAELKMETLSKENFDFKKKNETFKSKSVEVRAHFLFTCSWKLN